MSDQTTPAMTIGLLSIFPELLAHYLDESVLGRAQRLGLVEFSCLDLRDGADDARRTVDDAPFGGGAGMVLAPEPRLQRRRARSLRPSPLLDEPRRVAGSTSVRRGAAATGGFSLLCGRYEGVDQRIVDQLVRRRDLDRGLRPRRW